MKEKDNNSKSSDEISKKVGRPTKEERFIVERKDAVKKMNKIRELKKPLREIKSMIFDKKECNDTFQKKHGNVVRMGFK